MVAELEYQAVINHQKSFMQKNKKPSLTNLNQLVATYELPEIDPVETEEEGLRFIIEVWKQPDGTYMPRVLRHETFNVAPSYIPERYRYDEDGSLALYMHELTIYDDTADWQEMRCESIEQALQCVIDELETRGFWNSAT